MAVEDRSMLFVRLLAEHERRLQHYVRVLIPDTDGADDVLQESKLAMWQHFEKFSEGTNFNAWAHRFVFNRVLEHRRKKGRDNDLHLFSDEFYEMISDKFEKNSDKVETQIEQLKSCIQGLETEQRKILELRYFKKNAIEQIAEAVGKTATATYRALSRVRFSLRDCLLKNTITE
jgi:RNA polymerase sigma-70 factor, ECF subfamily